MSDTAGKSIECKAMVAWESGKPLSLETIQVAPPKEGEVRLKVLYSSVCQADTDAFSNTTIRNAFPVILGHEGAGVVESVGPGVTEFQAGDHVITLYLPQCKTCEFCLSPKTNLCSLNTLEANTTEGIRASNVLADGTSRFLGKDQQLYHFMGCSTFSEYTVVAVNFLCKIPNEAALEKVCLLACEVSAGYGAPLNTAKVESGSKVAVFGLDAIGLAVILRCKEMGASEIWAIDVNPAKFELAKTFGATNVVNPDDHQGPIQEVLVELTGGGLDYTFECTGINTVMSWALEACHKGWGSSVIMKDLAADKEISTRLFQLVIGKTWKASVFGGWKSKDSVPLLVNAQMESKLNLDPFITHTMELQDLNKAIELMNTGKSLKIVISVSK